MEILSAKIEQYLPEVVALRHDLHQNPELGYEEVETSTKVAARLAGKGGFHIETGVANTGIVATLGAEKPGKCIALRADMDCLPILEESGKPWASKKPGRMHACGHDGHTSCLLGTALVLSDMEDQLKGPVKFIFQPAEEGGAGGKKMLDEGALEDPKVEMMFGLHGWPSLNLGEITTCSGPMMANADEFKIRILGKGGHAAFPHRCINPLESAGQLVSQLNALTTSDQSSESSAVVTVAMIEGGSAFNIIPDVATLTGTIRTLSTKVQNQVFEEIKAKCKEVANSFGSKSEVEIIRGYPVLVNHQKAFDYLSESLRKIDNPIEQKNEVFPQMVGEDFAYFAQKVPACFFGLGLKPLGAKTYPQLHQATFDFNDDALPIGMRCFGELVLAFWD